MSGIRAIETLARDYPHKTGKELFEMHEADKKAEEKRINNLHKEKRAWVKDMNENGGYFKGTFGLNQMFARKINEATIYEDGRVLVDVTSIVIFAGDEPSIEIKSDFGKEASKYGFIMYERITKEEYDRLFSSIVAVQEFWGRKNNSQG